MTNQPDQGSGATFDSLSLHPDLLRGIRDLGFTQPTPIQAQAIPAIIAGRDVIGCAQTGTGKTAAFVLPILHRLLQHKGRGHTRALIIAPTRELALQSMEHLKRLSKHVHLKGIAVFGGVPMQPQITSLRQGVDIISATPGRLLDHVYSGRIDFVDLQVVVLDEADRMLDMGFMPDIQKILKMLPVARQSLLFSATMAPEIAKLAHQFMRDPVTIEVGQRSAPVAGVKHAVYPVARHRKFDLLVKLLRHEGSTSVIVFTRTKHFASRLTEMLQKQGFTVSVLHGDRSQDQRMRALERFRHGKSQIMVATDIAARGIDIEDISHVINCDVPHTPDDYIHRIGRTARASATGEALTLVDVDEEPLIRDIEAKLKQSLTRLTFPDFDHGRSAHERPSSGRSPHRHPGSRQASHPRAHSGPRHPQDRSRHPSTPAHSNHRQGRRPPR